MVANWVQVRYHVWWPGAGNDPFYLYNTSLNQTRNSYYGNNFTPHMFTGGGDSGSGSTTWQANALNMVGEDTPITIEINGSIFGSDVDVSVLISSDLDLSSVNTRLIVAATMDSVYYAGPNGLQHHHAVIIEYLTADNTGDAIILDGNNNIQINYFWTMDSNWPNNSTVTWDISNLNIVAFVQNYSTKEVIQAELSQASELSSDVMVNPIMLPENSESTGPFDVELEVTDQTGTYTGEKWFHYEVNSVEDSVLLSNTSEDLWEGTIPEFSGITGTTTMNYWMTMYNASGDVINWPSGTSGYYSLIFGPDTTNPVVRGLSTLYDVHYLNPCFQQLVEIDSVYDDRFNTTPPILHWTAGLNEEQTMMMTVTDTVFLGGMLIYSWEGNLSQTENNAGDTTYYWITVEDGSAAHNEAFSEIKYFITGQKQIIGHWDILDPFSNLSDIANWTPFNEVMIQEGFGWDQFLIENINSSEGDYDEMTFDIPIDLSDFTQAWLMIPMAYNFHDDSNIGNVEISTDNENWQIIESFSGYANPYVRNLDLESFIGQSTVYVKLSVERNQALIEWLFDDIVLHSDVSLLSNDNDDILPNQTALITNYPNPFNPVTEFSYTVESTGLTTVSIFDISGRELETIVNEVKRPGSYITKWDGSSYASGVYFYRLITPNSTINGKMLMLK